MTLDAGAAEWIGDNKVALGTLDGRLFVLELITDSSETVRSMVLEHVFGEYSILYTIILIAFSVSVSDTSIAYCMTLCAPGRLFVGSRLGDSQFLEFTIEKEEQGNIGSGIFLIVALVSRD